MFYFFILFVSMILFHASDSKFEPYRDNSGTMIGIAGRNFCLIAADTRLSEQYMIHSRNVSRVFEIEDGIALTGSGCLADLIALTNVLKHSARQYLWENKEGPINVEAMSFLMSNYLYSRRRFPYYSLCILGGIDKHGFGALYRYDSIGSFERVRAVSAGKGEHLIQSLLDEMTSTEKDDRMWSVARGSEVFEPLGQGPNLDRESKVEEHNVSECDDDRRAECVAEISLEEARMIVAKAFAAAAEREITIGDGVQVWVITSASKSGRIAGLDTDTYIGRDRAALPINYSELPLIDGPVVSSEDDGVEVDMDRAGRGLGGVGDISDRQPRFRRPSYLVERSYFSLPKH